MKLDADDIYVAYHEGRMNSSDEFYPAADYEELEAEVARLRKELQGLYEHTKNDMQIAGLNVAAKEALEARYGIENKEKHDG